MSNPRPTWQRADLRQVAVARASRRIIGAALALAAVGSVGAADLPLGDPMRPYAPAATGNGTAESARRLELSGVLVSGSRRVAVINGALYREGEAVNGARITRIERGAVRLKRRDEELVLLLRQPSRTSRMRNGDPTP